MQVSNGAHLPWQCLILLANLIVCNSQTYCNGTQYLSINGSGEIMSHSGAGVSSYQNNMRCYWQITAPTGSIIAVLFTYADFETCCDYVSLYDGSIGSTSIISQVSVSASSGNVLPRFTSYSNTMTVYFYSDSIRVNLGFKLSYDIFNSLTSSSSCGAISYTNSSNMTGVITSHVNFGSASYSPNMTCLRTLPKRSGYTVSLTVTSLSLGSGDCLRLPTSLLDMNTLSSTTGSSVYCGSYSLPSAVTIDSDEGAQIVFSSNGQNESSGFSISFAYAGLIKGNFSVSNDSGEITSHSGVGISPYSNNMRYYWQITARPGSVVWIKFAYISLHFPNDAVAVYDYGNGLPLLLAAVTDSTSAIYLPQIFTSASNIIVVRFRTGSSGSGLGFRLQFNSTTIFDYCSGFRNVSATDGGEIVSHSGVRHSDYLNSMTCTWLISAPTGYKVTVWFTYLDLENCCDKVTLYEGNAFASGTVSIYTTNQIIAGISGFSAPAQIYKSTSNSMTVRFTTDGQTTRTGFVLRYSAQPVSEVSLAGAIIGGNLTAVVVLCIAVIVCKCCCPCCNGISSVQEPGPDTLPTHWPPLAPQHQQHLQELLNKIHQALPDH